MRLVQSVIEAKDNHHTVGDGCPIHDRTAGSRVVESELALDAAVPDYLRSAAEAAEGKYLDQVFEIINASLELAAEPEDLAYAK